MLSTCIEKTLGERLLGEGLRSKGDYVEWIGLGGSEGEVIEEVGDIEEVGQAVAVVIPRFADEADWPVEIVCDHGGWYERVCVAAWRID